MNQRTQTYFDELVRRAVTALPIPREPQPLAQPNACHENCDEFARRHAGYEVVRGWLVFGGHWFVPHSVVRQAASREMTDITPDPSNGGAIPFVEHMGSEDDFAVLRQGRDGGWLHVSA